MRDSMSSHPSIPTVAVILPTYRRGRYLLETLQCLEEQDYGATEVLVVDQTPLSDYAPEIRQYLQEGHVSGRFRWIRLDRPSVSRARNVAIMEARSEVLLYLDDDIEPVADLIHQHLRCYEDEQVAGVVGPVLQPNAQEFRPPPAGFLDRSIVEQAFTYFSRFDTAMQGVGFMWANNFSVKREAVLAVGGWDEHIINYGDRDLGIRLASAGWRIDYNPQAAIVHLNAPSGGTRVTDAATPWQGWQRSVSLFYLAFRHLRGVMFWKYGVYRAARFSVLLRQNVLRPWRWPGEWYGFVKAAFVARRWARAGLQSPFV